MARVCREWELSRSTLYAQRGLRRTRAAGIVLRRRGPVGPCDDQTLTEAIHGILDRSYFHGERYRTVWAGLRIAGVRTSTRRILRVMREAQLTTVRRSLPSDIKRHDRTIVTQRPDQMWSTALTLTLTTAEGRASVFAVVDHCTREFLGIHTSQEGTRFEALQPIRQAIREVFGSYTAQIAVGLALRRHHGSVYLSDHFQDEVKLLGIQSSPALAREPEGNGCIERFFRTLKDNLLWVRGFETVEALRVALLAFRRLYNDHWILHRHGYLTPSQVRVARATRQFQAA